MPYNLRSRRQPVRHTPPAVDSPPPTTCTTTNAINALDLVPEEQQSADQLLLAYWTRLGVCFRNSFPPPPLPFGDSPCSRIIQPLRLAIWAHEEIQGPQLNELAQILHGNEATGLGLKRVASRYQTTPAYLCFLFLGSATLSTAAVRAFCVAGRVYPDIPLLAIARSWLEQCQAIAVEPTKRRRDVQVGSALRTGLESLW